MRLARYRAPFQPHQLLPETLANSGRFQHSLAAIIAPRFSRGRPRRAQLQNRPWSRVHSFLCEGDAMFCARIDVSRWGAMGDRILDVNTRKHAFKSKNRCFRAGVRERKPAIPEVSCKVVTLYRVIIGFQCAQLAHLRSKIRRGGQLNGISRSAQQRTASAHRH
jgi:hypothetical protein